MHIKISQTKEDMVLIDDDPLVHMSWIHSAKEKHRKIHSYFDIDSFFLSCDGISIDTPVYIDSQLGDNKAGEYLSEQIYLRGFKNIYLVTGRADINIEHFPWIKNIYDKSPQV